MSNVSQVTVSVPTELKILGDLTQSLIAQLRGGATMMGAVGAALPVLFAEGAKWDELKAEVKDPQAIVLAALLVGEIAVSLMAKAAAAKKADAKPVEHAAIPAAH